jgi:hypothetical protein
MVDARMSVGAVVAKGFAREAVMRIRKQIMRSQFKRRMPLIAKVSSHGYDADKPTRLGLINNITASAEANALLPSIDAAQGATP